MIEKETFESLDSLLDKALELPDQERSSFIAHLQDKNPKLAIQLSQLLDRLENAESFLDKNAERARDEILVHSLELLRDTGRDNDLKKGERLGSYRIERVIGRGLRATVYFASRDEEGWTQEVAIKLMARGVNTDDVLRRFYSERQILTELRSPGICTLLDGGVTDDGLPYFVMEHIHGVSITEHCRENNLDVKARIQLFREVCSSVALAHRHLVVHRDIKPENILVTAKGQVKLLDFGIAKLLEPDKAQSAAVTQLDARPMTPAYSSPEQMSGEAITTSTDVYQLGLLLSEMLTGVASPLKAMGIEAGSRPAHELSRARGLDDADLPYRARDLRGDLEWIVLKCLEPDPSDRYGSAEELRVDIDRYLDDQPVSARKATVAYLTRKFVRRRPGLALSGAITLAAIFGFVVLMAYFNVNLARERTAAVEAAVRADESATRAEEVKDLLVRFLTSADPYRGSGADTPVSELLADAELVVDQEIAHRPELRIELLGTLSDVYSSLSLSGKSAQLRQQQLDLLMAHREPGAFEILHAERMLVLAQSPTESTESTLLSLQAVLKELVERHPDEWLERARINGDIGSLMHVYGRDEDAVGYVEQAVMILKQHVESPEDLAASLLLLGTVAEDVEQRLTNHREAARILELYRGPEHPLTLNANTTVASTLSDLARFEESLEIFDRVIPIMERELGELHAQTLTALNNRAVLLSRMGENEAAIAQFREVLSRDRQVRGNEHRDIANRLQNLGAMLNRMERYDEAIESLNEAARIYAIVNLPGNPSTAFPHITLADINGKLGNASELEFHSRTALALLDGNLPDDHHAILKSRCLLGDALLRQGQVADGTELIKSVLQNLEGREIANPRLAGECSAALAKVQ